MAMVGRLENKIFAANQSGKGGEHLTGLSVEMTKTTNQRLGYIGSLL